MFSSKKETAESQNLLLPSIKTDLAINMTRRETIAMHLYAGMLSCCASDGEFTGMNCAYEAVQEADLLIEQLDKKVEP